VSERLLQVRDLRVTYPGRAGWGRSGHANPALAGVDLDVESGGSVGIVGESGCGKSTLARAILGLVAPQSGSIAWRGVPVPRGDGSALRRLRREAQIVFQDPFGSLDPRMTLADSVAEALVALEGPTPRARVVARVAASLAEVGLDPSLASRYPHEVSGGQCQRAAIARATIARPGLLVCDEAVSALDVSVQAQIVNLLADLSRRHGMALVFISHNLAVVRHLCDEVVVLYCGRVVERGPREAIFASPRHPYTRALLDAVPAPDPVVARRSSAVPAALDASVRPAPGGCDYRPRCPRAGPECAARIPALATTGTGHAVACHHPLSTAG